MAGHDKRKSKRAGSSENPVRLEIYEVVWDTENKPPPPKRQRAREKAKKKLPQQKKT